MRLGSLFSGVGGLELGLEAALGCETVWQVEQDEYCRAVLEARWPRAERHDNVCTAGAHNLAAVDIVCGGFPCQDISYAGNGSGLAGERSGLWREYARIIRELRPRVVVVENVAALLARGLGDVLGDLASLGYDAEWSCIRASDVCAPHRRDRLFVIAWRVANSDGTGLGERRSTGSASSQGTTAQRSGELADADGARRQGEAHDACCGEPDATGGGHRNDRCRQEPSRPGWASACERRAELADADGGGRKLERVGNVPEDGDACGRNDSNRRDGTPTSSDGRAEPGLGRDADGLPSGVDIPARWPSRPGEAQAAWEPPRTVERGDPARRNRLKALGNAVVPQVAYVVGLRVADIVRRLDRDD